MKTAIYCIVIFCLNFPVSAIDYNDFPPNLQTILNERIGEMDPNGGVCIAGRIKFSDDAYIANGSDVMVNLQGSGDMPLWVYEDGWFMMKKTAPPSFLRGKRELAVRAFGYDPIDEPVKVRGREITYIEFIMGKTPPEEQAVITGVVTNDQNEPVVGAHVVLSFPFANYGVDNSPEMRVETSADGSYLFEGLSSAKYSILAATQDYAYDSTNITPNPGEEAICNLVLFPNRKIIIDYVYQEDGSRNFTGPDIQKGRIEWLNDGQGVDFSDGAVEGYEWESLRDIEMRQTRGNLHFQICYTNGKNGFFDMGAIDFDSVTEAPQATYTIGAKQCASGHVYVVRTYDENNYAKFVVRDIQ